MYLSYCILKTETDHTEVSRSSHQFQPTTIEETTATTTKWSETMTELVLPMYEAFDIEAYLSLEHT